MKRKGRPPGIGVVKTERLPEDISAEIKAFFGTVKNAYVQLNMADAGLSLDDFRRVMKGAFERPAKVMLTRKKWEWFCKNHNIEIKQLPEELRNPKKDRAKEDKAVDRFLLEFNNGEPFKFLE